MLFVPAALSQENPMKLLFSCKASGSALHLDFSHHAPETFFFVSDQCRVCFILPYHQGTKRKAHTSISQYCAKFPPLSFLLFFLDPTEFALRDIQLGACHAYLIAAEKVAIRLDVVSGLKKDLAEFQGDGIWRDRTSFKAVSRSSASRFCDSTVSLKTDFNVWISSSLYSGRTVTPSSFASTFCFSWLHFAVCAPCFSTHISPPPLCYPVSCFPPSDSQDSITFCSKPNEAKGSDFPFELHGGGTGFQFGCWNLQSTHFLLSFPS